MTTAWAPAHAREGRHRRPATTTVRWDRVAGAVVLILATLGGVTAGVQLGRTPPPPVTIVTPQVPAWADPGITEDDVWWNCLTMGNGMCGPEYVPVTAELADVLTEAEDTDHAWETCLTRPVPDATEVVCPDGYVTYL